MKNRLLATIALCGATAFSATPLWAEWANPEIATTTLNLEEGGSYYFYLRKANMFLVNGNSWSTQTSLGAEGKIIKVSKVTDPTSKLTGWALEMPDAEANNGGKPKYLYTKDGQNAYVDYNMEGSYLWKITKNADGNTYRIKILDEDPNYGIEAGGGVYNNCYMGWDGLTTETGTMSNTIVRPFINPSGQGYENAAIDWEVVTEDAYKAYQAKTQLKAALEYAEKMGFKDYAEYETIYNNPDAKEDEVLKAAESLTAAADTYYFNQATEDNPLDATMKIQNPSFDNKVTTGWSHNMSMSPDDGIYPTKDNQSTMKQFLEAWTSSGNSLGDKYATQTVSVPDGKYTLQADIIAHQQADRTADPLTWKGAYLIADGGMGEQRLEVRSTDFNGDVVYAKTETLDVTVIGGKLTIGFRTISTNCNWVGVDNFKLICKGSGDNLAAQMVQETKDELIAKWADYEGRNYVCSQAMEDKYNKAIADAEASLSGSVEQDSLINLNARLLAVMDEMDADFDAYDRVDDVLDAAMDATVYMGDENTGYFPYLDIETDFTKVQDYYNEITEQVEARTFVADSINTIQDNMVKLFKEDLWTLVKDGKTTDLYGLLSSPDFTNNSTSGWSGSPSASNNVAEKYFGSAGSQSCDVYQELKDVPNGAYTITMKGFCRPGNYDTFTPEWETDPAQAVQAYVYGNTTSALIKNILSEGSDEPYISKEDGSTNDKQTGAVEGKYFANDRASAEVAFAKGQYVNTIKCVVYDGVLRFGVKMNTENGPAGNWVVFDEFRVNYDGEDATAYLTSLTELKEEVTEYYTPLVGGEVGSTVDVVTELTDALTEAEDIINTASTDVAKISASMDRLKTAKANAEESVAAVADLSTLITTMYDKADQMDAEGYNTDELVDLCGEVEEKLDANSLASIAEVDEYTAKLNKAVTKAIMDIDAVDATKDTPANVTALISNPGFSKVVDGVESNTSEGWIMEKDGGNNACNYSEYEFWNNNSFKLYQQLYGLNSGYYKLTCRGYYRAGGYAEAAAAHRDGVEKLHAQLYAGTYFVPLQSIIDGGTTEPKAAANVNVADSLTTEENPITAWYIPNAMSDAQPAFASGAYQNSMFFEVTEDDQMIEIGVKKDKHIENDWTIFDTFELYYYGSGEENRPDAVESVEEAAEIVSTTYYDMTGAQIAKPTKRNSLYIRRDVLSNGKVKSATFILR